MNGLTNCISEYSRIYQFAKLYLFAAVTIFSCPLAMTDGAARLTEVHGDEFLKKRAFSRLISRDPNYYSTSGQWMTERTGGSDVSMTSTIAVPVTKEELNPTEDKSLLEHFPGNHDKFYKLSGYKFFTSATTSGIAYALGRIQSNNELQMGNKGLSCFYIEVKPNNQEEDYYHFPSNPKEPSGKHSSIEVLKLKEKLGTKAVPTAELILNQTPGYIIGERNKGISTIAEMFNITRIHNAVSSCALYRRALMLAVDFASKRVAFGKKLKEHALHVSTVARVQSEYEACMQITFYCIALLGERELGLISKAKLGVYRLLLPLIKLYTAKACVRGISECLECLGGTGYMEDSGVPRLLRDAQVLPIWEGTTNVLSVDVLRVLASNPTVLNEFFAEIARNCEHSHSELAPSIKKIHNILTNLKTLHINISNNGNQSSVESIARDFSYSLATVFAAGLMIKHAQWASQNLSPQGASAAVVSATIYVEVNNSHFYFISS